tara:strand:- start:1092 stop:1253 length:162 start_codon:yes stop_codon:yes gene_type:complete
MIEFNRCIVAVAMRVNLKFGIKVASNTTSDSKLLKLPERDEFYRQLGKAGVTI